MDPELTQRLTSGALDVLAEQGLTRLTFDGLAKRLPCGKAAVYRRWATVGALVEQALADVQLVPTPADHGSLRADLLAMLKPWTAPLDRDHRAAGALVSGARTDDRLRETLMECLVRPLEAAVAEVFDRGARRGEPATAARVRLTTRVIQATWWQRAVSFADPMTLAELTALVDDAMLPARPGHRDGHRTR